MYCCFDPSSADTVSFDAVSALFVIAKMKKMFFDFILSKMIYFVLIYIGPKGLPERFF